MLCALDHMAEVQTFMAVIMIERNIHTHSAFWLSVACSTVACDGNR